MTILILIDLLLYFITNCRVFYWIAVVMIIAYLSTLAFVIGMYIPLIGNLLGMFI